MAMAPTRPIMRYYGGKWRMAAWVISHFPPHRVYVEPFGGAASVLMRKPRSYAEVYNDLDGDVVNVFRVLRNPTQARELERLLRLTPFAREEFEEAHLVAGDPIEQARRTIVRSFLGFGSGAANVSFNTGFRAKCSRSRTHPASHDWVNYADVVPAFCERLAGVIVENRPALDVIRQQDKVETLFYVDPPYPVHTRSSARQQYTHEMDDNDHRELAAVLRECAGMVIASGYACALYDEELFTNWERVECQALADGARERTEVLWISPRAAERVRQQKLFRWEPAEVSDAH